VVVVAEAVVAEAVVAEAVVVVVTGVVIPTRKMNGSLGIGNARNVEITSSPETLFVECAVSPSRKEISVDHHHLFGVAVVVVVVSVVVVVVVDLITGDLVWVQEFVTIGQILDIVALRILANFHTIMTDNNKCRVRNMVKCEQNSI